MKFEGIMPALVTPFNPDETVNLGCVERLVDDFIERGADGFYIAGATGEGLSIRPAERMKLAECAVARAGKRAKTIVQVASTDFHTAIELAKHAEACGADAISSTAPIFFGYKENEVYEYYKALAGAVHIPLMIYYNPGAGFDMSAKFLTRCFEVDNITSVKWTSSSYDEMMQLKDMTNGEINIINGPDLMLLMGLAAGADGGIGTHYNYVFKSFKAIYDDYKAGKIEDARRTQMDVNKVISAVRKYRTIPAVKALMEHLGYNVGNAAFPMTAYTAEQKVEIAETVKAAGWKPW